MKPLHTAIFRAGAIAFLISAWIASAWLLRNNPLIEIRLRDLVAESRALAGTFAHDAAIAQLEEALRLAPDRAELYVELGRRIALIYEWDRAIAAFDRAASLAPDYPDTYYFRGLLYASAPSIDARSDAMGDFNHYLLLAPEGEHTAEAEQYLGVLLAQQDALSP